MIVSVITRKIKSIFLLVLSLIRRCFCCLRKRRYSDVGLPISVQSNESNKTRNASTPITNTVEEDAEWDAWDGPSSVVSEGGRWGGEKLSTVEQHIQEFRLNQQKKMVEVPDNEPEPNYFEDLAPKLNPSKQQVVILSRPNEEQQVSNRLSISLSEGMLQSNELLDWNEDEEGWEAEAEDEDLSAALMEQRRNQRQQRKMEQLRRKAEKDAAKAQQSKLATKLS